MRDVKTDHGQEAVNFMQKTPKLKGIRNQLKGDEQGENPFLYSALLIDSIGNFDRQLSHVIRDIVRTKRLGGCKVKLPR